VLQQVGLQFLPPQHTDTSFDLWWESVYSATNGIIQSGISSLIMLGVWVLRNHRNHCVFDKVSPNLGGALIMANKERRLWEMTGAWGLSLLFALSSVV
jgi:hypothetical protein